MANYFEDEEQKKVTNNPIDNLENNSITNQSPVEAVNQKPVDVNIGIKNYPRQQMQPVQKAGQTQDEDVQQQPQKQQPRFTGEALNRAADEARAKELENINRYGIELSQEEYDVLNKAIANAENPEEQAYRYGTAIQYSRMYGVPFDEAVANLDRYNAALWGSETKKSAKEWYKAVTDAWMLGTNTMKQSHIGNEMRLAAMNNDMERYNNLAEQYALLEQDNALLQDDVPRKWYVDALKYGMQSAPFTFTAAGAGILGSLIAPGAGKVASWAVSAGQAAGLEYAELRANGASHQAADFVSILSGGLQGVVEVALGDVPAIKALGKGSGTFIQKASGNITEQLFKRLHYTGTFKTIAQTVTKLGLDYGGEVIEEGLEEATQNIISESGKYLTSILSDEYNLDEKTAGQIAKETMDAFRGGVLGSLILSGLPLGVNAKATYDDFNGIKNDAITNQSKESFIADTKEKIKNGETHAFDNVNDDKVDEVLSNVYDNLSEERDRAYQESVDETANIRESKDLAEGTQEQETDEEGDRIAFSNEYRDEEGRIFIQDDVSADVTSGDTVKGRILAGDPTRPHNNEESGNRYGYIDYEQTGDTVEIKNFKMSPGREALAEELFESFAERFAGSNIVWNPKFETNTALKQRIMQNNPQGMKSGLNYFSDTEAINANRQKIKLSKDFRKWLPNWKNEQIAAGVALTQAAANAKNMSLEEYTKTYFQDGQMFTAVEGSGLEQTAPGQTIYGAAQFDKDSRAIIYVSKHADFNTFTHELAHVFRKTLDADQLAAASSAFNIADSNNWTRAEEETFADGFVDYLRTGKAPTTGLKELFEKAARFIADIIRGLQGTIDLSDDIKSVYDSLLKDEDSGLAKAMAAANMAEKEAVGQEKMEAAKAQSVENAEEETQTEQTEETQTEQTEETTENAATETLETMQETTVENPNLASTDKAETVVDAAGMERAESVTEAYKNYDALFQTVEESQQQLDEVRQQYEGTDKWMKAPNGKDTNLTEKQWLTVRTPNFINWFGDWINNPAEASKVVDENGEPRIVYHGTTADFDVFDFNRLGEKGKFDNAMKGYHFVSNPEAAYRHGYIKEWNTVEILNSKIGQNFIKDTMALIKDDKDYILSSDVKRIDGEIKIEKTYEKGKEKKARIQKLIDEKGLWNSIYSKDENNTIGGQLLDIAYQEDPEHYNNYYRRFNNIDKKYSKDYSNRLALYLNIRHPTDDLFTNLNQSNPNNYDGVINRKVDYGDADIPTEMYIVPNNPNAIKSATDNAGTFSADNPSILFQTAKADEEYFAAIESGDMDKAAKMVEDKAAANGFTDAIPAQSEGYKLRIKPAPKKTKKVYKTFFVDTQGKPSALFIDNSKSLPMNVWIDAKDAWHFTADNGRDYVPTVKNPNRTGSGGKTGSDVAIKNIPTEVKQELIDRGYISSMNTKKITAVSYRPGWHAGDMPIFPQGGRLGNPMYTPKGNLSKQFNPNKSATNYQNMHEWNQVVFEVEIDADKDYTEIAQSQEKAYSSKGEFLAKNADLQYLPDGGFYKYTTNPTVKEMMGGKGDWFITDSIKIIRALSEEECNEILEKNGLKPQEWVDKDTGDIGKLDLSKLGYTGPEYDAARKTLAPITYDDNGNVIPLSQRFNRDIDNVLFQTAENPQVAEVRKQYEGTDKWMKAPNGNDTNLSEEQWLTVRTPNFINWFGDWINNPKEASKVVDENGEPRVVYHGSLNFFDTFRGSKDGALGEGIYFSHSYNYAKGWSKRGVTVGKLYEVYLNIRNPYVLSIPKQLDAKMLQSKGYDGVFQDQVEFWVAYNPSQVKSATENLGNFNPLNPSILFQIAGEKGAERLDKLYETTERIDNLNIAKQMEAEKKDAKSIKLATGWEKGADGKWKYELDDSQFEFDFNNDKTYREQHPEYEAIYQKLFYGDGYVDFTDPANKKIFNDAGTAQKEFKRRLRDGGVYLSEILKSKDLYTAYPELEDYKVVFRKPDGEYLGKQYPDEIEIVDRDSLYFYEEEAPSILLHEVQHAIQSIEGFAIGGNTNSKRYYVNDLERTVSINEWYSDNLDFFEKNLSMLQLVSAYRKFINNPETFKKSGWYFEYGSFGYPKNKALRKNALLDDIQKMYKTEKEKYNPDKLFMAMQMTDEDLKKAIKTNIRRTDEFRAALVENNYYDALNKLQRYAKYSDDEFYHHLAGEVEARNVQNRRLMSQEKRLNTSLAETEDYTKNQQIVLFQLVKAADEAAIEPDDEGKLRIQQLAIAKIMEADNESGAAIEKATGWKRNEQNKWSFNPDAAIDEYNKELYKSTKVDSTEYELGKAVLDLTADVDDADKEIMQQAQQTLFQTVYHGTSAEFFKFNMQHLSEGRGSQNYGRGLYFTGDKEMARDYATKEKQRTNGHGFIYKANIPEGYYLDWDADIATEQIDKVADAYAKDVPGANASDIKMIYADGMPVDGGYLYYYLMTKATDLAADRNDRNRIVSEWLADAGMLGVRYSAEYNGGSPDVSNYVVFDDQKIEVLERTLFQMEKKSMIGLHNLSEDALRHVIKMGGLANPSMAVIDIEKNPDFSGYGEITLIAPTWLIDKKEGKNAGTYGADIYSPRYPSLTIDITDKGKKVINNIVANIDNDYLKRQVKNGITSYIENSSRYIEDAKMYIPFLLEKGDTDYIVKYSPKYSKEIIQKVLDTGINLNDIVEYEVEKNAEALSKIYTEVSEYFTKEPKENWDEVWEDLQEPTNPKSISYNLLKNFIYGIKQDVRQLDSIDEVDTLYKAKEIVEKKYKQEFQYWAKNILDNIEHTERIYNGIDERTGNRKYLAHTLANVSKYMKQQELKGGESFYYGLGSTRAKFAPQLNTLNKIKKEKGRLVTHEEFEKVKADYNERFKEIIDKLRGDNDYDTGAARFEEAILDNRGMDVQEYIKSEYGISLSDDFTKEILQFANDLKDMPTEYFETKFTRPVMINEFTAAIIPDDLPSDLKQYLQDNGLMLQEYNKETGRVNVITNLPNTIGQKRNILFQTEEDMLSEAASFDSWEEWKSFNETFGDEEDTVIPSNADTDWYKKTWEKARQIQEGNAHSDENVDKLNAIETMDEDEKDKAWYAMLEDEGKLDEFLISMQRIKWPHRDDNYQPADQEEVDALEREQQVRNRIEVETNHQTWQAALARARADAKKGDTVELKPRHRKSLMTMIRNSSRDYRDLYAAVMNKPELSVAEGERIADELKNRMAKHSYKIASPDVDFEAITPEKRRQYAELLDLEDLRKEVLDGTLEMDMEYIQQLIKGYDKEIARLNHDIENLKKADTENAELLRKTYDLLEKKEAELKEKIALRRQAEGVRDIKVRLIKAVNRKVDFKRIAYKEGKEIIAIQSLFHPILRKFVNKFINMEGPYIRDAYSKYKTDFDYRAKLKMLANASPSRNAKKVVKLMEEKPYDQWTAEDRELVAKSLPRTDWIDALDLDELEKKRAGSLQLDLQSEETQELIREALPDDLLALLTAKDLRTWTLEEMESLVAVVNDLFKEGRDNLNAIREAAIERAESQREKIRHALKSSGIVINPDDSPAEKERKQKANAKFLEKQLPKILGQDNAIKGTLAASAEKQGFFAKVLHGYGDANIRRVARILDNGRDGVNTTLLYYRENECFNREQRAIQKRTEAINQILAENDITLDDLYKTLPVHFPDGGVQNFTIDELLFMEAANADDTSRAAVACGNMYDETTKIKYRSSKDAQLQYEEMAMARYEECLKVAATIPENVRKLLYAIEHDYDEQYDLMNKVSIEEYNQPVWRVEHYVPLNRLESNGDENANRLKEDLLAASGSYAKTFGWVDRGMTQKRVEISPANQRPVQLGLYSTWTESMQRTEHFIAYAAYLRDLNRIYKGRNSGAVRQLMENRYGRGMVSYIDQYINETANPKALNPKTQLDRIVRALRGKTAPAYLSWKMSAIIKQLCTSPWPFMQYVSPWKYASAALDFATKREVRDAIKAKSAYMNSRVYDPIIDLVNEQKQKATNKTKYAFTQFEAMGMKGLEAVDWACVAPGWLAVYREEYARLSAPEYQDQLVAERRKQYESYSDVNGWDWVDAQAETARMTESEIEEKAVLKADDVTRMCQPSSRITDLSPIYKESNELAKAFLQFTTSLNVIWQNIRYDLPNAVRNREWNQAVGTIAGYTLAGIAVGLVSEGLGGDDDDEEKKAGQLAFYAISQYTDSVPVIGSMLSNTVESTLTNEWKFTSSNNLFPITTKAVNGVKSISKEEWDKAAANFGEAAGLAIGLPVSGVKEILTTAGVGHDEGFYPQAEVGRRPEK